MLGYWIDGQPLKDAALEHTSSIIDNINTKILSHFIHHHKQFTTVQKARKTLLNNYENSLMLKCSIHSPQI